MRTAIAIVFGICFATASLAQVPKVEVPKVPELPKVEAPKVPEAPKTQTEQQTEAICTTDQCCCQVLTNFQCAPKTICESTGGKCAADDKCK